MHIREELLVLLKDAVPEAEDFDIVVPEDEAQGHYATSFALKRAKALSKKPMEYAEEIVRAVRAHDTRGILIKVSAASPGFVNFWLAPKALHRAFGAALKQGERFGDGSEGKKRKVIVEYSQPNIAKRMHVGHLRTTVLGDALANLHAAMGYRVIRWNYLGDWGTQFGNLIAAYKLWGKEADVKKDPVPVLHELYVRFHDEAKKNEQLHAQGQAEFKKLEDGDKENLRLWKWFKKESLKAFEKLYRVLGVKFDVDIGESFFEGDIAPLVADLKARGIAKESQGALVVPLGKDATPALLMKADGASLYLTRDIANLAYRIKKYKAAKILYVVGNEQSLHFAQLFQVAQIVGLTGPELFHVKYGLVRAESGKKLSTREGRAVFLEDVLKEAEQRARAIVSKKSRELPAREKEKVAHMVAVGALKYAILKEGRTTDIVFDWDKMLDFAGESAPYLQYTSVRLSSIVRKAGRISRSDLSRLTEEKELGIIRAILEFPHVVKASGTLYATNHLATYLYKLATRANSFYESTPILRDEDVVRRNARLQLVQGVVRVISRGLALLGIHTPERM